MTHHIRVGEEVAQDDAVSALDLKRAMLLGNLLLKTRKVTCVHTRSITLNSITVH